MHNEILRFAQNDGQPDSAAIENGVSICSLKFRMHPIKPAAGVLRETNEQT